MSIKVDREDLSLGGQYDETFIRDNECGECGARLRVRWRDGDWWVECSKDRDHATFQEIPTLTELWKRGKNPFFDILRGPYPGRKKVQPPPDPDVDKRAAETHARIIADVKPWDITKELEGKESRK